MQKRNLPYRRSIRLKGWDYRNPGLYFITICTRDREPHFGEIRDGIMGLSAPGCVAWHYWREIPDHHVHAVLDECIVMPNHLHGIVGITTENDDHARVGTLPATSLQDGDSSQNVMSNISPQSGSISTIIRSYKSAVTRWCRRNGFEDFAWQSRFYDHIIRNERSLDRIRKYIFNNPLRWQIDREQPERVHEQGVEYMIGDD